jgi:hypothetical protein
VTRSPTRLSRSLAGLVVGLALVQATDCARAQEPAPPRTRTEAGTWRSPQAAKRLVVRWVDVVVPRDEKPAATPPVEAPTHLPLDLMRGQMRGVRPAPRPAVVLVFDPSFKFGELLRLERDVFGTEEMIIAAKFVHTFRLKESPRFRAGFYVAAPDGKILARLPLNASRRNLRKHVADAFAAHYEGGLEKAVGTYANWLGRLEAAEDAMFRERTVAAGTALAAAIKAEKDVLRPPRRKTPGPPARTPPR